AVRAVLAHRQHGLHALLGLERQQVDDRLAARIGAGVGDLVHLEPVDAAGAGERQQRVVRVDDPDLRDEVFFLDRGGHAALAAAALCAVDADRLALRVAGVRQRDDDVLGLDQVEHIEGFLAALDYRAACGAEFLLPLGQLFAADLEQLVRVFEDLDQPGDIDEQLLVLVGQLLLFQPGQAVQAHLEDFLRLRLGQLVPGAAQARVGGQPFRARDVRAGRVEQRAHGTRLPAPRQHALLGNLRALRRLDQIDHRVDVRKRDGQPFEDVGAAARLAQLEDRAPRDDLAAMADERFEDLLQRQQLRLAVDQCDHVDAERDLHLRLLEQVVQQHVGHRVAAHFDDHAHAVLVGLVAQLGDALDRLLLDQLGDLLDQPRLVDLVRQLADDDRLATVLVGLDIGLGAHQDAAATGLVRLDDAGGAVDDAGGREV